MSSFQLSTYAMPSTSSTNMPLHATQSFPGHQMVARGVRWRSCDIVARRSHARHSRGSTQLNGRSHRAPSLDAPLVTTNPSKCAPAVRASAHFHQSCESVLEPLLSLRVCRGDAPDGGSRFRAQNPPPTAPFVRLSLTGCSIDGKKGGVRQPAIGDVQRRRPVLPRAGPHLRPMEPTSVASHGPQVP